jgi:hypothetical protein
MPAQHDAASLGMPRGSAKCARSCLDLTSSTIAEGGAGSNGEGVATQRCTLTIVSSTCRWITLRSPVVRLRMRLRMRVWVRLVMRLWHCLRRWQFGLHWHCLRRRRRRRAIAVCVCRLGRRRRRSVLHTRVTVRERMGTSSDVQGQG